MSDAPVPSPCIKVCVLDPEGAYCTGCLRTLDEIAQWGGMTNDERRAVLEAVAARREKAAPR
ncbi:MAG TPA: DUF1289 domain-containing protein [Usitatibacter sp.]|nr:DUF1289 domain-containing protein [Usitatibacter sp.]